jgi:hypothetical protein
VCKNIENVSRQKFLIRSLGFHSSRPEPRTVFIKRCSKCWNILFIWSARCFEIDHLGFSFAFVCKAMMQSDHLWDVYTSCIMITLCLHAFYIWIWIKNKAFEVSNLHKKLLTWSVMPEQFHFLSRVLRDQLWLGNSNLIKLRNCSEVWRSITWFELKLHGHAVNGNVRL